MTTSQPCHGTQRYPGTPRWVKGFGILALLAIVAFAVLHAAAGGIEHLFDHRMTDHPMPAHGPAATTHKEP
jgi:hypothetical protein